MTLVLEKGIEPNMILSSLSTMVGVSRVELHRKEKKWVKGSVERDKKNMKLEGLTEEQ